MRFTGNYDYYFFSEQPVSDAEERSEIYTQQRNQAMGFMRKAFTPSDDPAENIKKFVPLGIFFFAVFARQGRHPEPLFDKGRTSIAWCNTIKSATGFVSQEM